MANSPELDRMSAELLNYAQKIGQARGKPMGAGELAREAQRFDQEIGALSKKHDLARGPLAD